MKVITYCELCGAELIRNSETKGKLSFCNRQCQGQYKHLLNSRVVNCSNCGKKIRKPNNELKIGRAFCNHKCHTEYRFGSHPKHKEVECEYCGKTFTAKTWCLNKNQQRFCSRECWGKWQVGENNPYWKGGITNPYLTARNGQEYKDWRFGVFKRDNFTCQKCGDSESFLNAHHIFSFEKYEQYRFVVQNGITFCEPCHLMFHSEYGIRKFKPEDTMEYLKPNLKNNVIVELINSGQDSKQLKGETAIYNEFGGLNQGLA